MTIKLLVWFRALSPKFQYQAGSKSEYLEKLNTCKYFTKKIYMKKAVQIHLLNVIKSVSFLQDTRCLERQLLVTE